MSSETTEYFTLTTTVGLAKIADALAGGEVVKLTEMAIGDGAELPVESQTELQSEQYRFNIQSIIQDQENPNWIKIEGYIPPETGGFTIRELGIFDIDGDLIFIARHPEIYKPVLKDGSAVETFIRMVCQVTNAESVTLNVDTSLIYVTRAELEVHHHDDDYAALDHDHEIADVNGLQTALNGKAATNHTHTQYASKSHSHSGYASKSHSHSEYALKNHTHSGYAATNHTHTQYASKSHSHGSQYAPFGYVVKSKSNNVNGHYRIWSDGFKEQWGWTTMTVGQDKRHTFPVSFSTSSSIVVTAIQHTNGGAPSSGNSGGTFIRSIATSSFTLKAAPDVAHFGGRYYWTARGY